MQVNQAGRGAARKRGSDGWNCMVMVRLKDALECVDKDSTKVPPWKRRLMCGIHSCAMLSRPEELSVTWGASHGIGIVSVCKKGQTVIRTLLTLLPSYLS